MLIILVGVNFIQFYQLWSPVLVERENAIYEVLENYDRNIRNLRIIYFMLIMLEQLLVHSKSLKKIKIKNKKP